MKRFSLCIVLAISAQVAHGQTVVKTIMHDNIERSYRLYVPSIYNGSQNVPLVFNLHGYTSNAFEQEVYGDFRPIADTANFILVHPDGTEDMTGTTFWNAFGSPTETVDDIGFLSALIDTLAVDYNIDLNRVYSTGMSNGGFMSYTLACQLSERIAAIASVTGTMVTPNLNACNCQHPMPVMQIHGTADLTVPYNGNAMGFVAVEDLVDYWVDFNGCNPSPTETAVPNVNLMDGCTADRFVYTDGDNGASVELYRVNGGAHTWPGANPFFATLGITNQDFSASVEIWRFFRQFTLDQLVSVKEELQHTDVFTVYPNPSGGQVSLHFANSTQTSISVFDAVGRSVLEQVATQQTLRLELPKAGIYFLRVATAHRIFSHKLIVQ
jgi:polyhydroxybutyrate depolymerase